MKGYRRRDGKIGRRGDGVGLREPYPLKWATTPGGEESNWNYERTFGLHASPI
jgi:hypothetical protein